MTKKLKKISKPRALLLFPIVLILFACSDNNDNNSVDSLSITSYNMGLALNFVPYTAERLVANEALVATHESDVICFQEVWLPEQVEAITNAVSANYPYLYTVAPEQIFSETAACTTSEVAGFADCATTMCPDLSGTALVDCATSQCGVFIGGLSSSCLDGVIGAVGIPNITVDALVAAVTQPAGKFAFDGSLGLMLASRFELTNTEFQDFINDSSGNHRGALYAEITLKQQSHVIACTHPTANLSATINYPLSGKHGSWEVENRFMQQQMIAFVNAKAGENPILFAGDFNCSTANASNQVDAEFSANCQLWLDDGFIDVAAEQLACSFCSDENLILIEQQNSGGGGNTLLDHVFIKNVGNPAAITAERVFDQAVEIIALNPEQDLASEDSPLTTHPSDHFGVQVDVPVP